MRRVGVIGDWHHFLRNIRGLNYIAGRSLVVTNHATREETRYTFFDDVESPKAHELDGYVLVGRIRIKHWPIIREVQTRVRREKPLTK